MPLLSSHDIASSGGATALIAGIAKPLPRWAGFVLVPAVALSSVRACPRCLLLSGCGSVRS